MANGLVNKGCQILLMRLQRHEWMNALVFCVVGCDFLVEMQLGYMATILGVVFYNGHGGVIA